MKTLIAGRYRLTLTEIDATGHRSPPSSGEIELSSRNNSIHGIIGECPILNGSWSPPPPPHDNDDNNKTIHNNNNNNDDNNSILTFTLLYNGSLPFQYTLDTSTSHGTYQLLQSSPTTTTPLLPDQRGTLSLTHLHLLESSTTIAARDFLSTSTPANRACRVEPTSSLPIPCPSCDNDDGSSSRLSFFDMVVPRFGRAELVSLSCAVCFYRESQLRTVEPPKEYGVTLRLSVGNLDGVVVLTDAAVVRCDALELEMRGGTGKISNVEGVLRGCVGALRNAGIFSDEEEGGGEIGRFGESVDRLIEECRRGGGGRSFVVEIDDPLGLSYMEGADVIKWERTQEQNEELGLVGAVTVTTDNDDNPFMVESAKVLGCNDDDDDTKRLLRHCEAMAAEFTKEYKGYDHKAKDLLGDEDGESISLVESICDYAGCD